MPYKLLQLRALVAVEARGRLVKAAAQLHKSQPAVSRAIRALEREIGATLVLRRSTGLVLTSVGRLLAERAAPALCHLAEIDNALQTSKPRIAVVSRGYLSTSLSDREASAFIATIEAGSIRGAAGTLSVSQPNAHRAIAQLEKRLATTLLERSHRGVSATPAGLLVYRGLKLLFTQMRRFDEERQFLSGTTAGRLRVGSTASAKTLLAPRSVQRLSELFPRAQITMLDGKFDAFLQRLAYGDIDFILGTLRPQATEMFSFIPLYQEDIVLAVRTGHPLLRGGRKSLRTLLRQGWILPAVNSPHRREFEQHLNRIGLPPPVDAIETGGYASVRALVGCSNRIALVSRHQIYHELKAQQMAVIQCGLSGVTRTIGLIYRGDLKLTPLAREFMRIVLEQNIQAASDITVFQPSGAKAVQLRRSEAAARKSA